VAVGGGYVTSNVSSPGMIAIYNNSAIDANTWAVSGDVVTNFGDTSYSLAAFVICVNP
jgi:hypothetical protein